MQIRDALPVTYRSTGMAPERQWRLIRERDFFQASVHDKFIVASTDQTTVVEGLLSDLELWVAEHARGLMFVHAGCVAHEGRAIVVPGRTMSSLTAALVRAGATYFSDEYAVLDGSGHVRAYPRQLWIRPYDGSSPRRVAVGQYGGAAGRGRPLVGLIAALRYDQRAGWSTRPWTQGEALLGLIDNTVAARSRPRGMLTALERATQGAVAITGTRGDADEAAVLLLNMLC
jgi:hypothetical protein